MCRWRRPIVPVLFSDAEVVVNRCNGKQQQTKDLKDQAGHHHVITRFGIFVILGSDRGEPATSSCGEKVSKEGGGMVTVGWGGGFLAL